MKPPPWKEKNLTRPCFDTKSASQKSIKTQTTRGAIQDKADDRTPQTKQNVITQEVDEEVTCKEPGAIIANKDEEAINNPNSQYQYISGSRARRIVALLT